MSKLRKTKNNKLILVLPMILVISFAVLLTYSFANFKSIKLFDAVGGFFLGNEYTLSYDVANCTNKTIKNGKTFGELCEPAIPDGYTFEGWFYNNEEITSSTNVRTNHNIELTAQFTLSCNYTPGDVFDFTYNGTNGTDGSVQTFNANCPGMYKLETWGAQGGTVSDMYYGGYGGYSVGNIMVSSSKQLFIVVGGKGQIASAINGSESTATGGYNGGGNSRLIYPDTGTTRYGGAGGGATHIALESGLLKNLESYKGTLSGNGQYYESEKILIVAGGGGGFGAYKPSGGSMDVTINNASGGGISGNTVNGANGGTQVAPGYSIYGTDYGMASFGQGGSARTTGTSILGGAGGGGFFGGGAVDYSSSQYGAGGSGYIANSSLFNKKMYCYSCNENGNEATYTVSTYGTTTHASERDTVNCSSGYSSDPISKCAKAGNGHARITYFGNTTDYSYSNSTSYYEYTVPVDGLYKIELWGASGGGVNETYYGGRGAYTSGTISLAADTQLYFYIGGQGGSGSSSLAGGYNGGAASKTYAQYTMTTGSGGGATDVRYFESTPSSSDLTWNSINGLNSRIMVAAGGGGADYTQSSSTFYFNGGSGGGLTGYQGGTVSYCNHANCTVSGLGGTQTSPGGNEYSSSFTITAEFGKGGTPYDTSSSTGAGGGSGYYGGGGGSWASGSGGGGSSYISGYLGSLAIAKESNSNPRALKTGCTSSSRSIECSTHYSYKMFDNGIMIDGNGCDWSTGTAINCGINQKQPNGSNDIGHTGNGYARITYLGSPDTFTVTFNASGGNVSENNRAVIKNNQIGELPIPTNGDYAFNGWYLDSEYTNEVSSSYVVTENITLYAKWDLNKLYLYRNGNISTLVGSFKRIEGHGYSYEMNPSVTYADSYIRINSGAGNTNNYSVALVSNNLINTTGYNKLCVTASHNGSGCNFNNGYYAYGLSTGNSSITSGYVSHLNGMVVSGERTPCVNISNYNSSYYLAIGNSYSGYSDFSEVWLEK